jgi:hypothetical protein
MKNGKGFLLLLLMGLFLFMGLGFLVLSVFTLIPSHASKLNRLGYYSICSYSPISTMILLALSAVSLKIAYRKSGQIPDFTY